MFKKQEAIVLVKKDVCCISHREYGELFINELSIYLFPLYHFYIDLWRTLRYFYSLGNKTLIIRKNMLQFVEDEQSSFGTHSVNAILLFRVK